MKPVSSYRIAFMGTPDLAAVTFSALIQAGFNMVALIAQADKPVGRQGEVEMVPTKKIALQHHIPVFQPIKIKDDHQFLASLDLDLIVTLAYGQIVPEAVLKAPRHGCLNIHGSLLPSLRGASPIRFSLIHGHQETGLTLMEMVQAMDAGKMYAKQTIPIVEQDNYTSLYQKFMALTPSFTVTQVAKFLNHELIGIPQDESHVTFAPLIKPPMEHLDLKLPKKEFINWIRGLSEVPGGYVRYQGKKLKIYRAHPINDLITHPLGTFVTASSKGLWLQLSDGQIALDDVQLEGKKRMSWQAFVNGYTLTHECVE
jgi:methionyl-tRNA formyltransferase